MTRAYRANCSPSVLARSFQRQRSIRFARSQLACAEGQSNQSVARKRRCSLGMVGKWRGRFLQARLEGLYDEPRPGAPRKVSVPRSSRSSFRLSLVKNASESKVRLFQCFQRIDSGIGRSKI